MENQKNNPNPSQPYPWYNDRVAAVRKEYVNPWADDVEEPEQYTPKEIYDYLDRHVWKQDAAKRAASVITYHCLRSIKSNAMFIGPSGCGKTHIWRCLQKLFPSRIEITDISNLTQDGWKGSLKWKDLLRSPIFQSGNHSMGVLNLRSMGITSLVMTAFRLAALSMNKPTSFSSTMMAVALVRGSSAKFFEKSLMGIAATAVSPQRARMSSQSVPLPLLPSSEYSQAGFVLLRGGDADICDPRHKSPPP